MTRVLKPDERRVLEKALILLGVLGHTPPVMNALVCVRLVLAQDERAVLAAWQKATR